MCDVVRFHAGWCGHGVLWCIGGCDGLRWCWVFEYCVGIQKHFMVAEIPGFDLSNRLSDFTTSLFSSDGIGKLIFKKVK